MYNYNNVNSNSWSCILAVAKLQVCGLKLMEFKQHLQIQYKIYIPICKIYLSIASFNHLMCGEIQANILCH